MQKKFLSMRVRQTNKRTSPLKWKKKRKISVGRLCTYTALLFILISVSYHCFLCPPTKKLKTDFQPRIFIIWLILSSKLLYLLEASICEFWSLKNPFFVINIIIITLDLKKSQLKRFIFSFSSFFLLQIMIISLFFSHN